MLKEETFFISAMQLIYQRVIKLFIKIKETPELIMTLKNCIIKLGIKFLVNDLYDILVKCIKIIGPLANKNSNINHIKTETCKLLATLGKSLHSVADIVIGL